MNQAMSTTLDMRTTGSGERKAATKDGSLWQ